MKRSILALSILFSTASFALNINNENDYLVKKGDTLWDISEHFLKDPWEWKSLWETNPQIKNPHLIYPNDLIYISFKEDGSPVLSIERNAVKKTLSLDEKVSLVEESISDALPPVDLRLVKEFDNSFYMTEKNISSKILKNKKENIYPIVGDEVYIYNKDFEIGQKLTSLKKIEKFEKNIVLYKKTGELLITKKTGDLFIAKITKTSQQINVGDLIESIDDFDEEKTIYPKRTKFNDTAKIIHTLDRINTYKNNVVILNKGLSSNLSEGDILKVIKKGKSFVLDGKTLKTDNIEKGLLFVYKVDNDFSYAIIVKNTETIKTMDMVISPFKE